MTLHIDAVVYEDDPYRTAMAKLLGEDAFHHAEDRSFRFSAEPAPEVVSVDELILRSPLDRSWRWSPGGVIVGNMHPVAACGQGIVAVPVLEGIPWDRDDRGEAVTACFAGVRCFRAELRETPEEPLELADVIVGWWSETTRLLAREGAPKLMLPTPALVKEQHVHGSPPWLLAKHAKLVTCLDEARLQDDDLVAAELDQDTVRDYAISFVVTEVTLDELRALV